MTKQSRIAKQVRVESVRPDPLGHYFEVTLERRSGRAVGALLYDIASHMQSLTDCRWAMVTRHAGVIAVYAKDETDAYLLCNKAIQKWIDHGVKPQRK